MANQNAAPVRFSVDYPESLSRGHLILRLLLGWLYLWIPHGIILYFYGIVTFVVGIIAFFGILFTGRYPRGLYDIVMGYYRWSVRVDAYGSFMTDRYPPFSAGEEADYPVTVDIDYAERLHKGHAVLKFLLGWLYVGIPHGICLIVYGIAAFVALIIAFFAVLFTRRFPRGLFDFIVGLNRWSIRVSAYLGLMRDEYPPFHNRP